MSSISQTKISEEMDIQSLTKKESFSMDVPPMEHSFKCYEKFRGSISLKIKGLGSSFYGVEIFYGQM
jgi:hypothetical protein